MVQMIDPIIDSAFVRAAGGLLGEGFDRLDLVRQRIIGLAMQAQQTADGVELRVVVWRAQDKRCQEPVVKRG